MIFFILSDDKSSINITSADLPISSEPTKLSIFAAFAGVRVAHLSAISSGISAKRERFSTALRRESVLPASAPSSVSAIEFLTFTL